MPTRPLTMLAVLVLVGLHAPLAGAEARDPAGAEKLYDEGAALLAAEDWAGACAKFEQSQALDPAPGTVLNLASCAEHAGKIALAWSRLRDARSLNADTASAARREEIARFVDAAIARLEPRIPQLTIELAGAPAGATVTRDGSATMVGAALPVDPGRHVIVVAAPGFVTERREIDIVEGARETLRVELRAEEPVVAPPPPATPPTRPAAEPPRDEGAGLTGMQVAGLSLAGAGVASLGVSLVTGLVASGKEGDLAALGCEDRGDALACRGGDVPTAEDLSSSGSTFAAVSTVTTFVGLGLLGAGVVLFAVGGDDGGSSTGLRSSVGPGGARLDLGGRF